MTGAVFDCMVFLQAATNDQGPAFACLELIEQRRAILFVSPPILAEIRDVLNRPKIQRKFPHLTAARVDVFLQKIASLATVVTDAPIADVAIRDPDDLPYLSLAIAADAEFLVSRDKDLLEVMQLSSFVGQHPRLRILDPSSFLAVIRAIAAP